MRIAAAVVVAGIAVRGVGEEGKVTEVRGSAAEGPDRVGMQKLKVNILIFSKVYSFLIRRSLKRTM